MTRSEPPIEAVDEIRQLNRLFLGFLREQAEVPPERFGLSARASALVKRAPPHQIDRAASFPRALFSLRLPPALPEAMRQSPAPGSRERVVELVLLYGARNLCRMSGYWARLLLRLADEEVKRLRIADVAEIVTMSHFDGIVSAAFADLEWVWPELLTESRPEQWRRLLLIGFQPDYALRSASEPA
jgi:hypothetical protein